MNLFKKKGIKAVPVNVFPYLSYCHLVQMLDVVHMLSCLIFRNNNMSRVITMEPNKPESFLPMVFIPNHLLLSAFCAY